MSSDWKEEQITDYFELEIEKEALKQEEAEDQELNNVKSTMQKVMDTLSALEQPYLDKRADIDNALATIRETLITTWDITDKTYECDAGTATVRTTKSLNIVDKKGLIAVLLSITKLPEAIRSWNLSYLRKLKDVDMIEDKIAHYEEHQNVVIKGASDK